MPPALGSTLRVLEPAPHVLAFYDGRIPGRRAYADRPNWLDDGAYALGVASYAIVDGPAALVYDTHISLPHARAIRAHLESLGVRDLRVVLSHWHDDHIAGNEVFADVEILAHRLTAEILTERRPALEFGDPPIRPLVLPTRTWDGPRLDLTVGRLPVTLHHADIHSRDGVVLHLPDAGLLLVGDTLEDPITYVDEPDRLAIHLDGLRDLESWAPPRLLPNHGCPDRIAAGSYAPSLIAATRRYVEKLLRCPEDDALAGQDLRTFAAEDFASGAITYFAPYEEVHRRNVEAVRGTA
jgi:glyoxylase-like metal-dependent hydrolase (beta-lactamase superfamily II)